FRYPQQPPSGHRPTCSSNLLSHPNLEAPTERRTKLRSDMDFTHSTYFAGAPPYQLVGVQVPPLTPAHSNSVASDEFNTTSSPVGCVRGPRPKRTGRREEMEGGKLRNSTLPAVGLEYGSSAF